MPKMITLPFVTRNPNAPVMNADPLKTPMPEAWSGLQFWMDASWDECFENDQLHGAPDPWSDSWYAKWFNAAADRLKWTAPDGSQPNAAMSTNSNQNKLFPLRSTLNEDLIGGQATMYTDLANVALYMYGAPRDTAAQLAANTTEYTYLIIYKAVPGATGSLFGVVGAEDDTVGVRFGFPVAEAGKTMFQADGRVSGSRLLIDRNTANNKPTLAIVTGGGDNAGVVRIVNDSLATNHAYSFASGVQQADRIAVGSMGTGSVAKRNIALFARWSHKLSTEELNFISHWCTERFGPF